MVFALSALSKAKVLAFTVKATLAEPFVFSEPLTKLKGVKRLLLHYR
ncbi:hypothetical protein JCM19302_1309 [Jejuia pallidilutea]|uniref:Uncharacterized protein n=1 Tax=Jejuia pallidilutea TaxID=504487 RepID=A0A090W8R8_9FLAO|nr:hypothetical protein JCM19302_1309 [Jejuia pallidilutea]